jgi:hypothetical protein
MVDGASVFVALVESDDAKVGTLLEVGVFSLGVVRMASVIVKFLGDLNVYPDDGNLAGDPRFAIASVRTQIGSAEMSILELGPFLGPIALEEHMPSDAILCGGSSLAFPRVSNGVNGFTIKPGFDGFEDDLHDFQVRVVRV